MGSNPGVDLSQQHPLLGDLKAHKDREECIKQGPKSLAGRAKKSLKVTDAVQHVVVPKCKFHIVQKLQNIFLQILNMIRKHTS